MKNTRFIYDSILKYFSGLSLPIHWINTPNNLHPSNAGIGSMLNNARAKEMIPISQMRGLRFFSSHRVCTNLTIPTGPVSLFTDQLILLLSKESKFPPKVPSILNVKLLSAPISWSPASIALPNGNFISLICRSPAFKKVIPSIQSSSPHLAVQFIIFLSLWYLSVIDCPINFLSNVLTLSIETFCSLMDSMISHDCKCMFPAILPDITSFICTGISSTLPLVNPCDCRKESVGMR